ncbi:MAG: serine hydrolase domain-containing protein [Steroidobacteraceae bacterium]
MRGLLDALISADGPAPVASAVVRLERADGQVTFEGAAGLARPDTRAAMTLATPIHVASVAKTFTAALVLQLSEAGRLGPAGIDSALAEFGVFPPEILERLHRKDGVSRAGRITLRHLLTHTSGIRDAMVDDVRQCGGPAPGSLIGGLLAPGGNPAHAWVPWNPQRPEDADAGVINFFLASGIADHPLGEPGAGFHYSDTGYVILGLLVEKVAGRPLHEVLRTNICGELGLAGTYLAYRDDPPLDVHRAPEAEVYAGDVPTLTSGVSLSFDWGGGGVVSTAGDLAAFLRALIQGRLFGSQATREAMTNWTVPAGLDGARTGVGLGLFRTACGEFELWGHSGAWGTKMAIEPRSGVIFTGTTNQARSPADWHHPFMLLALGVDG